MSQIQLDNADLQCALDWAHSQKKLPKFVLTASPKNLRIELHLIAKGIFSRLPSLIAFSLSAKLDGQDLVVAVKGENLLLMALQHAAGGPIIWFLQTVGVELKHRYFEIQSRDTLRVRLSAILVDNSKQPLGDLVHFHGITWSNHRLELDFEAKTTQVALESVTSNVPIALTNSALQN